ncbi:hypothetical protein [Actinomarinicola tropica]|uniref:Uncharacterized protein n=1 Tax=Actinomarinicola tropica TaxID=2789776 RepID=A0A5Q2RSN6_9ACTN|nr:hypothetical protein [Actinomarinicola tropica]QGG96215.1 hypothetical protein GH723_14500 [Actinomarinicola tropica]
MAAHVPSDDRTDRSRAAHPAGSARQGRSRRSDALIAAAGAGAGALAVLTLGLGTPSVAGAASDDAGETTTDACRHGGRPVAAVADALDMTPAELRAELRAGATLAELAEERGVDIDELADAMLSGMEERLAERLADGRTDHDRLPRHEGRWGA